MCGKEEENRVQIWFEYWFKLWKWPGWISPNLQVLKTGISHVPVSGCSPHHRGSVSPWYGGGVEWGWVFQEQGSLTNSGREADRQASMCWWMAGCDKGFPQHLHHKLFQVQLLPETTAPLLSDSSRAGLCWAASTHVQPITATHPASCF